jgi:hypothetical protein
MSFRILLSLAAGCFLISAHPALPENLSPFSRLETIADKTRLVIRHRKIRENRSRNVRLSNFTVIETPAGIYPLHHGKIPPHSLPPALEIPSRIRKNLLRYLVERPEWVFHCMDFVLCLLTFDSKARSDDFTFTDIERLDTLNPGDCVKIGLILENKEILWAHYAMYLNHDLFLSKMGSGGPILVTSRNALESLYGYPLKFQVMDLKTFDNPRLSAA